MDRMKGLNVRFEETAVAAAAATETTMTTAVAPLPRGSHYAPTAAVRDCETRENVYCARFCSLEGAEDRLMRTFATCAGRRAEVYECEKSGAVTLVASFESGDANAALYACEWCAFDEEEEEDADADADATPSARTTTTTTTTKRRPCLALGGTGSTIEIVDCASGKTWTNLIGHGGVVNAIVAHPREPSLLASASGDLSVRLWHVKTGVTIAIFAGSLGHKNDVLAVDFHGVRDDLGRLKLVSGGMDNHVKVWATPPLDAAVAAARSWTRPLAEFKTVIVDAPMFSSSRVHNNYVDCVGWVGDAVLSKSVDGVAKLWVPDAPVGVVHTRGRQFRLVAEFPQRDAELWWIRFAVSASHNVLAFGNDKGQVSVWRLDVPSAAERAPARLTSFPARLGKRASSMVDFTLPEGEGSRVVRQCAVSRDGAIVVAACENGLICRWDCVWIEKESDDEESDDEESDDTSGSGNSGGSAGAIDRDRERDGSNGA